MTVQSSAVAYRVGWFAATVRTLVALREDPIVHLSSPSGEPPGSGHTGSPYSGATSDDASGQTRDVLVVEDDPVVREMLYQVLQGEGHTVAGATDGEQALTLLQQGHYRLLLLDLMMSGVDGFGVLRVLRTEPALRPPAVLILSAMRESTDVLAALEGGADDYISKPFDIVDLALRVSLWLRRTSPTTLRHAPGVHVHSLGRFYVEHGGHIRLHADTRPQKASDLFTYLLSRQGRFVSRSELSAALWPATPDDLRQTSLRTLLYQLRRLLDAWPGRPSCLWISSTRLALCLGPGDWWDVAEFRAWVADGARWQRPGDMGRALDAYAAGVALYGGAYLDEIPEATWTRVLRAHLRAEWLAALGAMAHLHGARGEVVEQEAVLRRAVQADPSHEPQLRALMDLLAAQGRHTEAVALYRELESSLRATASAGPAPETQALAARIARRSTER